MKMKAIREWWYRVLESLKERAVLADQDPWEVIDRRLGRVEQAIGLTSRAGSGQAASAAPTKFDHQPD